MLGQFYEKHLARPLAACALPVARAWRSWLKKPLFIGVTGSCGKTTTKEIIAAVLAARLTGVWSPGSSNARFTVFKTVMRARPHHDFCLMEMGVGRIGDMDASVAFFRPDIGIVLNIGTDHYTSFRGAEGVAKEKGRLVEALPENGTAILNADDPLAMAMTTRTRAKIFTFGLAPDATLRATDIRAQFPEPLSYTACCGTESARVQTRLHGAHQVHNTLAAIATGIVAGIPLAEAARAIAGIEPLLDRLNPTLDGRGVIFIQDTWKASMTSMSPALELMKNARVPRRWIVIGTLSDFPGAGGDRYRKVARYALAGAEGVAFVGRFATSAVKAANPENKTLIAFATTRDAHRHLNDHLQPGDVVLLKGSSKDHLERIVLDRQQPIACWKENCGRTNHCSRCSLLRRGL